MIYVCYGGDKMIRESSQEKLEKLKLQKLKVEEELKAKTKKLNSQIRSIEARASESDRKIDTRKKILLGAMVMNLIENKKLSEGQVNQWLSDYLSKDRDRVLFGLTKK